MQPDINDCLDAYFCRETWFWHLFLCQWWTFMCCQTYLEHIPSWETLVLKRSLFVEIPHEWAVFDSVFLGVYDRLWLLSPDFFGR